VELLMLVLLPMRFLMFALRLSLLAPRLVAPL